MRPVCVAFTALSDQLLTAQTLMEPQDLSLAASVDVDPQTTRCWTRTGDAGVTGPGHGGGMTQPRQTGLMVLRVWTEQGTTQPLRVDVRHTHDLSRGLHCTSTLTDVDVVLAAVRTFLETGRAVGAAADDGDG